MKQEIIDRPDLSVEVKLNEYDVEESFTDDFSQEDFPYYEQTESFSNENTKADQEQVHFDENFEEDKPLKKAKRKKNLGQKSHEKVVLLDDSQAGNYKSFQCDFCPKLFPTKSLLTTHTRRHTGERPFSCKFCPKKFSQKGNRKSHEKKCKSKIKSELTTEDEDALKKQEKSDTSFECKVCSEKFASKSERYAHVRTYHKKIYQCKYCQKTFPQKTNLDSHTRTHTGERPFLCNLCPMRLATKTSLDRHLELHKKRETAIIHQCHLCDKSFKCKSQLDQHIAFHEKPIQV